MNMEAFEQHLRNLVRLFGEVLESESRTVERYLAGEMDEVEWSRAQSERNLSEIQARLQELKSLAEQPVPAGPDGQAAREALRQLREIVAEMQELARRNRRFIQNSLGYTDRMLAAMFGGNPSYDGSAVMHRAEGGATSARGIRA